MEKFIDLLKCYNTPRVPKIMIYVGLRVIYKDFEASKN